MKKFTQILSRRLARGSPSTDSNAPTPCESNCFHQLRSSRLKHGDSFKRSSPRTGISLIVADDATYADACWICKGIDFPKVLNWQPGDRRPWVPLSHCLDPESPNCPYCVFFRAMLDAEKDDADGASKFAPYLRIRMAFERLGVGEKHELGGAVLFEVMSRNKSLPEGYLLKAAEDELDFAGYGGGGRTVGIKGRTVTERLDVKLPRTWIGFCKENHQAVCARAGPSLVKGLRLVDCKTRRLVSLDDFDSSSLEYVTLSSFWAAAETESFLDEKNNIKEDLPPLIADAISLTLSLGFRYLWIEGFCLSKLNKHDKLRQTKLIGEIFFQSALTIIVAAGEGIDDGIPGLSISREPQLSLQIQDSLFTTTLIRPDLEVAGSVWASRGWTFQEALFSRRRLVFTPSQAYFQCQTLHCHESLSLPLQLASDLTAGRVFPDSGPGTQPEHLKTQIKTYIAKEFASPQDRMVAFQGVLNHYSKMDRGVDHFIGVPLFHPDDFSTACVVSQTDRLAVGLGWMPDLTSPSQGYVDRYQPVYKEHFPSWSWLAWCPKPGHNTTNHMFGFNLVDESQPLPLQGVQAAPKMEIAVGFEDGMVLSWEIDGEGINKKVEPVAFLRLTTFTFDIDLVKDSESLTVDTAIPETAKDAVISWFRSSYSPPNCKIPVSINESITTSSSDEKSIPDGTYTFTAVLLSGKNWRVEGAKTATVLVCGENNGRLFRYGVVSIDCLDFRMIDDQSAVLESVGIGGGKTGDLEVEVKDIDVY